MTTTVVSSAQQLTPPTMSSPTLPAQSAVVVSSLWTHLAVDVAEGGAKVLLALVVKQEDGPNHLYQACQRLSALVTVYQRLAELSQAVTGCHRLSQAVTGCHAEIQRGQIGCAAAQAPLARAAYLEQLGHDNSCCGQIRLACKPGTMSSARRHELSRSSANAGDKNPRR